MAKEKEEYGGGEEEKEGEEEEEEEGKLEEKKDVKNYQSTVRRHGRWTKRERFHRERDKEALGSSMINVSLKDA